MKPYEPKVIDKISWGFGPWDEEPDSFEWIEHGFHCCVLRSDLGYWCGYVGVEEGSHLHGMGYYPTEIPLEDFELWTLAKVKMARKMTSISVHGGLTFAKQSNKTNNLWWFGFDCAHSGDFCPGMRRFGLQTLLPESVYRDFPYVLSETANLAKQLKAIVNETY